MTSPRELGIPLGRLQPGATNAITDVEGVRVGHVTIVADAEPGVRGELRTGVTAIWPHEGWPWQDAVYAGTGVLNGHGELIGICQIQELGLLRSPLLLTSSLAIGAAYDGAARWIAEQDPRISRGNFLMPVVTEVSDVVLSDNRAFAITPEHVGRALASASTDRPGEGSVGAGTGTICYDLKGGIGTASRRVSWQGHEWTVGALVLTNHGDRPDLTIGGVEIGPLLDVPMAPNTNEGSCIAVVATDAPLLPHQLDRLSMRGMLGLTRAGAYAGNTSGELAIAFSTATRIPVDLSDGPTIVVPAIADGFNRAFNALFLGAVEAVNEAVLNSMFASETTVGFAGVIAPGMPIDTVARLLRERGVIGATA
jgi:D-aminopeptidase